METLYQILGVFVGGILLFVIYQLIKNKPELFSKENLNKSFFTMGVLAIILIAFVALLVLLVKST